MERFTPQYTVPAPSRGLQGAVQLTSPTLMPRGAADSNEAVIQCSLNAASEFYPLRSLKIQSNRLVPASILQVTKMAVLFTPEASLVKLVFLSRIFGREETSTKYISIGPARERVQNPVCF